MAASPRRRTPSSILVHTGPQAENLPLALPSGKGGELLKVESWGGNNQLPQEVLKVLYDSGTATTCVERLGLFIGGKGFASPDTAQAMANPLQTFNQLLAEASESVATGLGVAYILRYTYGGELAEVYTADVDCLRREKDGDRYVVNPKLAVGNMPVSHNEVYLPYNPLATPAELSEQVISAAASEAGYWGHLLHSFTRKLGRKRYPLPDWWAAKEALEVDAEAPRYDLKQFRNGFFVDAMVNMVGKKYDPVPDDTWTPSVGETEQNRPYVTSPDLQAIQQTIKALKGARSEASVWANFVETKEELPEVIFFDKGPNSKNLTDATNRIEGRVYRRMEVPPVLCGVAEAGVLGNNQQIVNSIQLFGLTVNKRRALCLEPLQQFFPHLDFTVDPLDPVDYIDPAVAAVMTPNELRATRQLPPLEEASANQVPKPTAKPKPKAA